MCRDSSVGIKTRYGLVGAEIESRLGHAFPHPSRPATYSAGTHSYRSYMFRFSTILRELVHGLTKVTLLLKHSVKLRSCTLCGDVAACREMACVLFVVQTAVLEKNRKESN